MYNEPIFLQPVFQEKIWGGRKLEKYGYDIPSDYTGEAWIISAHPNGTNKILNGPLSGKTLVDAWREHGELFNKKNSDEKYPLLVKLLDASADLSVQVHPNDEYAKKTEGYSFGKTECWYVLDADQGSSIVFGHHARTQEELIHMIDNKQWNSLLNRVEVKKGDFVYIPSGTIHAIGKGIVILETQQSSDITYRVYDYDRIDKKGNKRELHLEKAKEVIKVPHKKINVKQPVKKYGDLTVKQLIENKYFTVSHWNLNGQSFISLTNDFLQISVISGSAEIIVDRQSYKVEKGQSFIIPSTVKEFVLDGKAEFISSYV